MLLEMIDSGRPILCGDDTGCVENSVPTQQPEIVSMAHHGRGRHDPFAKYG